MALAPTPPGDVAGSWRFRFYPAISTICLRSPLRGVAGEDGFREVLEELPVGDVVSAVAIDEPPVRAEGVVLIATVDHPVIVLTKAVDQWLGAGRVRVGIAIGVKTAPAPRAADVVRRRRLRVVRSPQTPALVAFCVEAGGRPGDAANGPV